MTFLTYSVPLPTEFQHDLRPGVTFDQFRAAVTERIRAVNDSTMTKAEKLEHAEILEATMRVVAEPTFDWPVTKLFAAVHALKANNHPEMGGFKIRINL